MILNIDIHSTDKKEGVIQNKFWWSETPNDFFVKVLSFLISPVLGFFTSFLRINTKSSYCIIFLSFLTFGVSFSVDSHLKRDDADYFLDGMWHRAEFEKITYFSLDDLGLYLLIGNGVEDGSRDVIDKVLKFLISRITDNYHFFFLCIAFLYSFFFLKSLRYLTRSKEFHHGLFYLFFVYLFCFSGIFGINGVRFVPAAWMSIYAIFRIFVDGNRKYIGLIVIAALLHSSMWIMLLIAICGLFLTKLIYMNNRLFMPFLYISIIAGVFTSSVLVFFATYLPDPFSSWVLNYVGGDTAEDGQGRFLEIFSFLKHVYMFIVAYLLMKRASSILLVEELRPIFLIMYIFVLFSNLTIGIQTLGIRFFGLTFPFLAYIWLKVYSNKKNQAIIYSVPLVYFYDMFYFMPRLYFKVLDIEFLYTSPLLLFYKYLVI